MAKNSGTKLKLLQNGTAISNLIDVSMSVDGEPIEVTNKDSNSWAEFLPGKKTVTISGSCDIDSTSTISGDDIFTSIAGGTTVAVQFYTAITGQVAYTMSGFYTKWEKKGGTEDRMTVDFTIQITGSVTKTSTT